MADYKRYFQIYDFVAEYRKARGISPTLAEIGDGLGLSKTTVRYHLETMEARGMVRRDQYVARGIVLLSRGSQGGK